MGSRHYRDNTYVKFVIKHIDELVPGDVFSTKTDESLDTQWRMCLWVMPKILHPPFFIPRHIVGCFVYSDNKKCNLVREVQYYSDRKVLILISGNVS